MRSLPAVVMLQLAALVLLAPTARGQHLSDNERGLAEAMVSEVSSDVRREYYDAKLHGLDWDALVRQTKLNISKAPDVTVANAEIAALLEHLNDSHTFFVPPRYLKTVDYGWNFQMFGNRCYVTDVRSGSDAEKMGIRPGDEVLTIDGFTVERDSTTRMKYTLSVLMPRPVLHLTLRDTAGKARQLEVTSAVQQHEAVVGLGENTTALWWHRVETEIAGDRTRAQYKEFGPELMILHVPAFVQTGSDVDDLFKKASEHKTLIIDLRGTPGGLKTSLLAYLGNVFDHDFKASDLVTRNKTQPLMVKSNHHGFFSGKLFVLVDSETASAGELFSRVVQLERRGTILGDRSSGRVMEAQQFSHQLTSNVMYIYGDSVTVADVIMSDGKSLEHTGVTPDEIVLPTATDLANGRDPVLAHAAELAGVTLSPEDAAKLFPRK